MKSALMKFRNWCNLNAGIFTFLALIAAILAIVPHNSIDLGLTKPFFQWVLLTFTYEVHIPTYILLLVVFLGILFYSRSKSKFKIQHDAKKLLIGVWKNEWSINGKGGTETARITKDFKYSFLDGRHLFNLEDITFDPERKQIEFTKVDANPGDGRKLKNVLTVENNDLLVGTEQGYKIRYRRIDSLLEHSKT